MMKFVPRSVMIGFVNALAIMIFTSQLQHFVGETWIMYALVALTLAIIYLLPRFTKAIPSTLVAIVVVTAIVIIGNINVGTVGDMGIITQQLPVFLIPDIPLTMETLLIILPYSFSLAIVGLVESLLTANIVDDMTDTESNKNKESRGQGIANIVTGFFGGMGGCAMIGQSVINVKSGGSGRLSSLVAGVVLMSMIMVSISTFDWSSLKNLVKIPKTDSAVMLTTIIIVLATHNLAIGVLAGVLLSAIFFAAKISKVKVTEGQVVQNQKKTYRIEGQLFFASVSDLPSKFYFGDTITEVEIDLTQAHLWDDSAIGALDKIEAKFAQNNINVNYIGLNEESKQLKKRIGGISNAAGH